MKDFFLCLWKTGGIYQENYNLPGQNLKEGKIPRKVSPTRKTAFVLRISVDEEETIYKLNYTSDGSKVKNKKSKPMPTQGEDTAHLQIQKAMPWDIGKQPSNKINPG